MNSKLSFVLAAGLVMFMVRPAPAQLAGAGDINGDGAIDLFDLAIMAGQWGGSGSADINAVDW